MLCSPLDLPLARLPGMADDMPWPERNCSLPLPRSRLPGMASFFAMGGQWASFPGAESAVPATGGVVVLINGRWFFALAPEFHLATVRRLKRRVRPMVPVEPITCLPNAPQLSRLGGFRHPLTGCYCEPMNIPPEWRVTWAAVER